MTSRGARRPWLALLAFAFAACGQEPEPPPHGLTIETLAARPEGAPVETFGEVRAGRWRVEVVKSWAQTTGRTELEGRAVLDLHVETEETKAGWEMRTEISVREAEGVGDLYVRAFDGLRVRMALDDAGRPDPKTLRFEAAAPPRARSFLRGLWGAGLAGGTPWFPPGALLRVGDAWTRERLGGLEETGAVQGIEEARIRLEGGGRLEAVHEVDGEKHLTIRLETLLTAEGATRGAGSSEAVGLGIRDRGLGTFRARDGLPLQWTLEESLVVGRVTGEETSRTLITLRVEGRTTTVSTGDR